MLKFMTGVFSITALAVGWIMLQIWIRKHSDDVGKDCDLLEKSFGCFGCKSSSKCGRHFN